MASDSFKIKNSINFLPTTAPGVAQEGDVFHNDSSGKLEHHDGSSFDPIVKEAATATLTNKTIDGDNNTIQDLGLGTLKTVLADADKFLVRDVAGIVVSNTKAVPTGVVVGDTDSQTLSNKTLATPTVTGTLEADAITSADIATSNTNSTVNIGTGSGTNTINIGGANTTINMTGTVNNQNVTDLVVTDKLITLNDGGAVASGGGSGIEVEENAVITGYDKVSGDRNSWEFKAPNTAGVASLTPGASNDTVTLNAATQTLTNKTLATASNTISATANHVAIYSGGNALTSEAQLAITRGGTGQSTQTAAFDALSPTTTKGDLIVNNGTNNVRQAVGTDGFVLTADSAQGTGIKWAASTGTAISGARASETTGQSILNATTTTIIFDTETEDIDSDYDNTTGIFTPSVAGHYQFNVCTRTNSFTQVVGDNTTLTALFNNSTTITSDTNSIQAAGTHTVKNQLSDTYYFNGSTDNIRFQLRQDSGNNTSLNGVAAANFMSIYRIG